MHVPAHPVRFVTAAALFDGHDAAINIMRRILQSQGAEVIHLGHNRSVDEIVTAAIQEDVQGVAISSYQGGHVEFFSYLVELLRERGAGHVKVYGGGGGVIVPEEIELLHSRGVTRIFSPEDGQRYGLPGMINKLIEDCDVELGDPPPVEAVVSGDQAALARAITLIESGRAPEGLAEGLRAAGRQAPVLGITGTGGSGKSSLTDELVRRFRVDNDDKLRIAIIAIDPTRRRGGGALLGDRIRMNSLSPQTYFRSLATRGAANEVPACLDDVIAACRAAGYDLVIVETPGIGQGDAGIVPHVDVPIYVMTPEFGAASQLEKIDMLDFAEAVVINKYERRGAEDALRDVRRQLVRNREAFGVSPDDMPVFGTIAARYNDAGVTALYHHLKPLLPTGDGGPGLLAPVAGRTSQASAAIVPPARSRYLADIAETVRAYHAETLAQAEVARRRQQLAAVRDLLSEDGARESERVERELSEESRALLDGWPAVRERYSADELVVKVRDREIHTPLWRETLSGNRIPRVALPRYHDHGDLLRFLRSENLPGMFPFTAACSVQARRRGPDPDVRR